MMNAHTYTRIPSHILNTHTHIAVLTPHHIPGEFTKHNNNVGATMTSTRGCGTVSEDNRTAQVGTITLSIQSHSVLCQSLHYIRAYAIKQLTHSLFMFLPFFLQAFSHFTYHRSGERLLICDIQVGTVCSVIPLPFRNRLLA
jgi:hypothetical protein